MSDLRSRAVGSVLGLALGDALGAPYEFRRAPDIPDPLLPFELSRPGSEPGGGTDDTAMARNLCRSLIARGDLDLADVLARHVEWFASDPADLGHQTRLALAEASEGTFEPARAVYERRGPEVSAGNGSVMYCAPLGVAYARRPELLIDLAPALSALTHWDERCRTACLVVTFAVAGLVQGKPGERAVVEALAVARDRPGGEELEFLVGAAGTARPIDGPDRGFVFFTAGVALRYAAQETPFERGLREVIALGGDTDTNAALTGALLGAVHGREGLPNEWLAALVDRDEIEREADQLADGISGASDEGR